MSDFNNQDIFYTSQQKYQIKLAIRQGLDTSKLENPDLSYQQMEVLRIALQEGIDIDAFCHPAIPLDEMKRQIELAENKQHIVEISREEYRQKKMKTALVMLIIVFSFSSIIYLLYSNREYLKAYLNAPAIALAENNIKLGMSEQFVSMDYLTEYDQAYEVIVSGQEELNMPGKHKISYCQSNGVRESCSYLYVEVYDDIAPQVTLKNSKVTVGENDDFNALEQVLTATDNLDGDLSKNVTASNFDPTLDTQEIIYTVRDSSGNTGSASLIVTVEKQTPVILQQPANQSQSSSSSISTSSSSNNDSKNENNSEMTTGSFYSINDYDNFESCMNQCLVEIAGKNGICTPVTDEDGVYIGYQASIY